MRTIATTVGDIFSKNFNSVSKEDTLSQCLSLFKKGKPPVLIVLDNKGKYEGLLAQRWIVRSMKVDPSKTKVEKLTRSAPEVKEQDSLSKAATLMIENNLMALPVFSEGKPIGIVTDEHIIHGAVMTEWGNKKIEEIMTKQLVVMDGNESVSDLLNLFREHNITHVPIITRGKPVGMVSMRDVIDHFFKPIGSESFGEIVRKDHTDFLNAAVKDIMSSPLITVPPETSLKNAEKKMHDSDISSLVISKGEKLAGIATKRDFLEPIAQMEITNERLVLKFSIKESEMDESQRDYMTKEFETFRNTFEKMLTQGILFVYMKTSGSTRGKEQLYHCRLHLRTERGSSFSTAEGWNPDETFRLALDRLERQIVKNKEILENHHELAKEYLDRINFPSTEF